MRSFTTGVILVAVLVQLPGCKPGTSRLMRGSDEYADSAVPAVDSEYERLLAGKSEDGDRAMEARKYLAPNQPMNGLWKTSRDQTLKWVEDLYQAGAETVYAVYSPADETIRVNMCASLLVKLPADREKRAMTIRAYDRIGKRLWGNDHEKTHDNGQNFLSLDMDP